MRPASRPNGHVRVPGRSSRRIGPHRPRGRSLRVTQRQIARLRQAASVAAALLLLAALPSVALAAPGEIEKIEVEGNEFISDEAFIALTDVEVGDRYDEQDLRTEF